MRCAARHYDAPVLIKQISWRKMPILPGGVFSSAAWRREKRPPSWSELVNQPYLHTIIHEARISWPWKINVSAIKRNWSTRNRGICRLYHPSSADMRIIFDAPLLIRWRSWWRIMAMSVIFGSWFISGLSNIYDYFSVNYKVTWPWHDVW